MDVMILVVITIFFALLGLVNFMVGVSRWMHRIRKMSGAVLVLEVGEDEKAAEALLIQAADITALNAELHGISMAVVCGGNSENEKICRHFCEDRGIPMVSQWSEISGILRR